MVFTHKGLKLPRIQTSNTPNFGIHVELPVSHKIELIKQKDQIYNTYNILEDRIYENISIR